MGRLPRPLLPQVPRLLRCRDRRASRPRKVPTHPRSLRYMRLRSQLDAPSKVLTQSAVDRIPPGPTLDTLTAEKVFGWKNVHKHDGALVRKKQDKAGRWRLVKGQTIRRIPSIPIR